MKKIDLTKGKVINVLTVLALPIMATSLLQFTYNLIDMLWVGALGSDAVASVGSSSFFVGLGYAINSMVVIGTTIKLAQAIGRKETEKEKEYINAGLVINLIIALSYGLLLIFCGKIFIDFLNLNNTIVERNSFYYLAINGPILFFGFFNMLYSKIIGSYRAVACLEETGIAVGNGGRGNPAVHRSGRRRVVTSGCQAEFSFGRNRIRTIGLAEGNLSRKRQAGDIVPAALYAGRPFYTGIRELSRERGAYGSLSEVEEIPLRCFSRRYGTGRPRAGAL